MSRAADPMAFYFAPAAEAGVPSLLKHAVPDGAVLTSRQGETIVCIRCRQINNARSVDESRALDGHRWSGPPPGWPQNERVPCPPWSLPQNLVTLNFNQEAREADFRYGLVRVRENAESIAFYGGNEDERVLLKEVGAAG